MDLAKANEYHCMWRKTHTIYYVCSYTCSCTDLHVHLFVWVYICIFLNRRIKGKLKCAHKFHMCTLVDQLINVT